MTKLEERDNLALLRKQVEAFGPISDAAWSALATPWHEVTFRRKQMLTRQGDTEQYLYLVLDGVQRAFCLHGSREFTLVFSYPPSFSGIVDSFLLQQPARYHLETLTESRFLRIRHFDFMEVVQQHREVETWLRVAVTQVLSATLLRQVELAAFTAEEKFTALLRRSPQVLQLIPHKYLASYIGVDATNFSKLLATVRL